MAGLPVTATYTRKGSLVLTCRDAAAPRALTAHVDTLGMMVRQIKGNAG